MVDVEERQLIRAGPGTPTLGREDRLAAGREIRQRVPRTSHGDWRPALDRPDPLSLLERQNVSRLPEYVPIRFGRMLASPFAFLRGAAAVMAADLSETPRSGLTVQACGDAHLLNFGVFGTQERNLVFGMNDFDETLPGPWEWDVKRLAASIVVAGRFLGLPESAAVAAAADAVRSYREHLAEYSHSGHLALWYSNVTSEAILAILPAEQRGYAESLFAKARNRTNIQVLAKTAELIDGAFRIIETPPLIVRPPVTPTGERTAQDVIQEWLNGYRASLANDRRYLIDQYTIVDVVLKVVGVGSVGTRCYVVLLRGDGAGDPLFLQVKEASRSVLQPYLPGRRSGYHGRRVVDGQRLIQPAPDIFLGWGRFTRLDGGMTDYYVRQLRDMKGSVTLEPGEVKPNGLIRYAALCGWALALAHARSGDAATLTGYLGTSDRFDQAIARFAVAYADQTERDHAALVAAVRSGRIEAISDI